MAQRVEQGTHNLVSCTMTQIVTSTEPEPSRQRATISDGDNVNTMSTARVEPNGNDGKDRA